MNNTFYTMIPLIFYLIITLYIAFKTNEKKQKSKNFLTEYYIGNRSINGFVLAMTVVSTYVGASSFISGPSVVNKFGLSWVLLAMIQVPVILLTFGILGKKLAIISRKINAITIMDILRYRYKNNNLLILITTMTIIFLISSSVAQFIGGAKLLQSMLNIPYGYSLTVFAVFIIIYTTLGGFNAIVKTDTIQSIIMMISIVVLFFILVYNKGGMQNITNEIIKVDPNLITPTSGGAISKPFIMSFWVLVGIGLLGIPSTTVRCIVFKDSKALHRSIIYGSLILGFIMFGIHMIGYISIAYIPKSSLGDTLIPHLAIENLHPIFLGIFIGGPLVAIMSTVDSVLIIISSSLVKDLYIEIFNKKVEDKQIKRITMFISMFIGGIIYLISMFPFDLIVWINLFALSGQEIVFCLPMLMGLFTRKATDVGAMASIITGIITLIFLTISKIKIYNMHSIIPSILVALFFFLIFNNFGRKIDEKTEKVFFEY